jgi:hypothetical protein
MKEILISLGLVCMVVHMYADGNDDFPDPNIDTQRIIYETASSIYYYKPSSSRAKESVAGLKKKEKDPKSLLAQVIIYGRDGPIERPAEVDGDFLIYSYIALVNVLYAPEFSDFNERKETAKNILFYWNVEDQRTRGVLRGMLPVVEDKSASESKNSRLRKDWTIYEELIRNKEIDNIDDLIFFMYQYNPYQALVSMLKLFVSNELSEVWVSRINSGVNDNEMITTLMENSEWWAQLFIISRLTRNSFLYQSHKQWLEVLEKNHENLNPLVKRALSELRQAREKQ